MEKSPRNKMITKADEETKGKKNPGEKLGVQVMKWFFPQYGRTVVAETLEEATEIINKEMLK